MNEEDDSSSSSSDLVSILKPTNPQPVPETEPKWSAAMICGGVILGVIAIAALFVLSGFGGSRKAGAAYHRSAASGSGAAEKSEAKGSTAGSRKAGAAHHRSVASGSGATEKSEAKGSTAGSKNATKKGARRGAEIGGGRGKAEEHAASDAKGSSSVSLDGEIPASTAASGSAVSTEAAGSASTKGSSTGRASTGAADKQRKPGSGKTAGSTRSSRTGGTSRKQSSVSPKMTKKLPERPLICVFGDRVDWKMRFPEDGLCDLAFYSALYADKANTFQGGEFAAGLRRVLAVVKTYTSTESGIAVATTGIDKASKDISSKKGEETFEQLWSTGVHHYGVLDFVPSKKTEGKDVQALFVLLKKLKKMQANHTRKRSNFKPYLAVGMAYFKDVNAKIYRSLEKALKDLKVGLVVLRTHLDGGADEVDANKGCTITGTTVWEKPLVENQPNIKDTLDYVRQRNSSFDKTTRLAISVSLAGRWYKSLTGGKNRSAYVVGAKCQPLDNGTGTQLDSRITVCTDETYGAHAAMDKSHEVITTYEESAGLAFVFDNEVTLFAKACKAQNATKGVRPIGLAVFDSEFDDWANACKTWNKFGNFTLTRTARKAVDVFKARNTTQRLECGELPG